LTATLGFSLAAQELERMAAAAPAQNKSRVRAGAKRREGKRIIYRF
jgi:hypothetical protein